MIRLLFNYNREMMHFIIKDKEIYYTDRRWGNWIRCMPKPDNFMRIIALSRNRIPTFIAQMFNYSEEELKEFSEAKDDQALADIVIRDAKSKGCIHIKPKEEEDGGPNK